MFEEIARFNGKGIYVVHSSLFDTFELMNLMAPSFVIGVNKEDYLVVFDPRSATVIGFVEEANDDIGEFLKEKFEKLLGLGIRVFKKSEDTEDPVAELERDVEFYGEMGVVVMEKNGKFPEKNTLNKLVDRFKIFNMISEYTMKQRYTPEELFLSISPGTAGMSIFITMDTRFMIWIKNETNVEGERFRYSLIRAFNVTVARLARKFKYERMPILPYENMLIINRNIKKLKSFFDAVEGVNENVKDFLKEKLPKWAADIKTFESESFFDFMKSREDFLDSIASIPDRKGVNALKSKLIGLIEKFSAQLEVITLEMEEWLEDFLR